MRPPPKRRAAAKVAIATEEHHTMPAYFLFDVREILDQDKVASYRSKVFATVEQYGGRYRVLGGPFERVEGDWQPNIPVIIEFRDLATARTWYDSEEYRPLRELRLAATKSNAVLIDGFDHDPGAG
jgi:uncharacterized protein (DUF1330 family)